MYLCKFKKFQVKSVSIAIYLSRNFYLAVCVGVLAADVGFFPSSVFKCCSSASNKELGAFVKSGMSPLSIPIFCNNQINYFCFKKRFKFLPRQLSKIHQHDPCESRTFYTNLEHHDIASCSYRNISRANL